MRYGEGRARPIYTGPEMASTVKLSLARFLDSTRTRRLDKCSRRVKGVHITAPPPNKTTTSRSPAVPELGRYPCRYRHMRASGPFGELPFS